MRREITPREPGPAGEKCETCRFFLITDYPSGYCRVNPPEGETARINIGKPRPWPLCYAGDWCGDYVLKSDTPSSELPDGGGGAGVLERFTPVVTFGGSSDGIVLFPETAGQYQIIGGFVHAWLTVAIDQKGSTAHGEFAIGGLPQSLKPFSPLEALPIGQVWRAGLPAADMRAIVQDSGAITWGQLDAPAVVPITDADLLDGAAFVLTGVYPVSAPARGAKGGAQ